MGFPTEGGAVALAVETLDGVAIAAGASVERRFTWPKTTLFSGVIFFPLSVLAADAALLVLEMRDADGHAVISDGVIGSGVGASSLLMCGSAPNVHGDILFRPFQLQRPVEAGDTWTFVLRNDSAGPITPRISLLMDDGGPEA